MFQLKKFIANPFLKRYFSHVLSATSVLEKLNNKSLISVVGDDAKSYLQGLITNDINHLSNNCRSLYAMFLNSKGRILYDTIIYRFDSKTFLIECDSTLISSLEKHLNMFKLRRKIDIFPSKYQIHVMFDKQYYDEILTNKESLCELKQDFHRYNDDYPFKIFKDPRVPQLGHRIISEEGIDLHSSVSDLLNSKINTSGLSYRKYRYSLGVGEGGNDIPTGTCFPLESNCDYLHGVSFHKGCYIGQELTARTYHTGVTRKRLMPLYFNAPPEKLPSDDLISSNNIKLGKLRGLEENIGLGLLRLELIKPNLNISIAGIEAVVGKPFWWPIDAPKEKIGLKK